MEEVLKNTSTLDAETEAAFDAAWLEEDAAEEPGSGTRREEAEDWEEGQTEEGGAQEDGKDEKAQREDQPLTFTLKHLDEVRTVDKDEVVRLAQQGMDYQRVRAERDQLRDYRGRTSPALAAVQALAERSGMSAEEFTEHCQRGGILPVGMDSGRGLPREGDDRRHREEMSRFIAAYPDVKAEEIPARVWQDVKSGESLTAAYTLYRNRELEAELDAERRNRENARKSTGSLTDGGDGFRQNEVDRWWYDE